MNIIIIQIFVFLIVICSCCLAQEISFTERSALIAFKSQLILEPTDKLSSNWSSKAHFCSWFGVSCSNQRVVALKLPGLDLRGTVSPHVANLTRLVEIDLSNKLEGPLPSELGSLQLLRIFNVTNNSFSGNIPANLSWCKDLEELYISNSFITGSIPEEFGLLSNLKALRLNNNNLTGKVPTSLGNLSKLEYFYLHENDLNGEIPASTADLFSLKLLSFRGNNFSGSIPHSIFNISSLQIVDFSINGLSGTLHSDMGKQLPNLKRLFLDSNRITGEIPSFLSNATKLSYLFFTENDLQGSIPREFGRMLNMIFLDFEYNRISGNIPSGVFNISSLHILKTRHNYLSGHLPGDFGKWLPNLQEIFLSHNLFSGELPSTVCNATKLVSLEVSNNSFSGPLPKKLGNLVDLQHLNLQVNRFVNEPQSTHLDFLNSLVNCRNLEYLIFESNPLNGILPDSVGNLSRNLKVIAAGSCQIKGSIPQGIGNLSQLNFLGLAPNGLEGNIPSSIIRLQNFERLYLTGNKLTGNVAAQLWSVKSLGILHLGENKFSGRIPDSIGNLSELREQSLAANNFYSTIPSSFWRLVKLDGFNLSQNLLNGSIPDEVRKLKAIRIMDLSSNNFSGYIPNSLGNLENLDSLYMSRNSFEGPIPSTFSSLILLEFLDLSSNALSGIIPTSLVSLGDLKFLNISFNRLLGEIPQKGVFANLSYESLMGNPGLCGAPKLLKFPKCPAQAPVPQNRRKHLVLKITIPIAATVLFLVACLLLGWINLIRKKHVQGNAITIANTGAADPSPRMRRRIITYYELVQATENFSESNLVGRGSSGMVYKGTLSNDTTAAVKVFSSSGDNEGRLKNFDAECEVLSKVLHRNLVRIISTCSNMDFRAMILEFMPNGSLDRWLHSPTNYLSIPQRLDIVFDTAQAMEYLHHEYDVPIIHCDLKPSNILLDEDLTAHVADFGIAKVLAQDQSVAVTRSLGTIGYIAPEYGMDGQVSAKGDVYSFGVVLLETFTGKKPTDTMFEGNLNLHQWVTKAFPDAVMDVLDPNIRNDVFFRREEDTARINKKPIQIEGLLVSIFHVALQCLKESPEERINMRNVVAQLKKIRNQLRASSNNATYTSYKPLLS